MGFVIVLRLVWDEFEQVSWLALEYLADFAQAAETWLNITLGYFIEIAALDTGFS